MSPVNVDTVSRVSSNCIAATSDSTLPDEPLPSSLLLAIVSSDEPSTQSTVTSEASAALLAYDADVVTESSAAVSSPAASFITSSSSYAGITQSFLPSGSVHADTVDLVQTAADCLLHSVPDDDDEEEMPADEQVEDWDQEVFDP